MSQETLALFAEMFGNKKAEPASSVEATPTTPTPPAPTPTEAETSEGETESETGEETPEETPEAETPAEEPHEEAKPEEAKNEAKPETKQEPFPKKDLGMGGAAFCDEILKIATPEILAKLKSGEKTMAGCWNWVYSHMENEYIKANGRVSGGMGADCTKLVERYFAEIPEGTVEGRVKPKVTTPATPAKTEKPTKPAKMTKAKAKALVKKIADKAAEDAKRQAEQMTAADFKDGKTPQLSAPKFDISSLMEMMK